MEEGEAGSEVPRRHFRFVPRWWGAKPRTRSGRGGGRDEAAGLVECDARKRWGRCAVERLGNHHNTPERTNDQSPLGPGTN